MEDTEHRSVLTVVWHESVNELINVRIIPNSRPGTRRNEFDIEWNRSGAALGMPDTYCAG